MRIAIISFGILGSDGRLGELVKVYSSIGECFIVSRGNKKFCENHYIFKSNSYWGFIKYVKKIVKTIGKIDVLVLDNRKSIIPGYISKKYLRPSCIIQDCRELYTFSDVNHISGKIGCVIERFAIKHASIVVAANEVRAKYMKKYYHLKTDPLVFENIRELEYSSDIDIDQLESKYAFLKKDNVYNIISTAGCNVARMTDTLVKNFDKVSRSCQLILAGYSSDQDISLINDIIKKSALRMCIISVGLVKMN